MDERKRAGRPDPVLIATRAARFPTHFVARSANAVWRGQGGAYCPHVRHWRYHTSSPRPRPPRPRPPRPRPPLLRPRPCPRPLPRPRPRPRALLAFIRLLGPSHSPAPSLASQAASSSLPGTVTTPRTSSATFSASSALKSRLGIPSRGPWEPRALPRATLLRRCCTPGDAEAPLRPPRVPSSAARTCCVCGVSSVDCTAALAAAVSSAADI